MNQVPVLSLRCSSFEVTQGQSGEFLLRLREVVGPVADENTHSRIYDKKGVAQRLGTSVRTIDNLMHQRRSPIPYTKVGGSVRFLEDEIQKWLEDGGSISARRARKRMGL